MLTVEDLTATVEALRETLAPAVHEDWSVPAGGLEWTVSRTVDHLVDAFVWYAAQLASSATKPVELDATPAAGIGHEQRLQVLTAATCILRDVVTAAPTSRRAWHSSGMSDAAGFLGDPIGQITEKMKADLGDHLSVVAHHHDRLHGVGSVHLASASGWVSGRFSNVRIPCSEGISADGQPSATIGS